MTVFLQRWKAYLKTAPAKEAAATVGAIRTDASRGYPPGHLNSGLGSWEDPGIETVTSGQGLKMMLACLGIALTGVAHGQTGTPIAGAVVDFAAAPNGASFASVSLSGSGTSMTVLGTGTGGMDAAGTGVSARLAWPANGTVWSSGANFMATTPTTNAGSQNAEVRYSGGGQQMVLGPTGNAFHALIGKFYNNTGLAVTALGLRWTLGVPVAPGGTGAVGTDPLAGVHVYWSRTGVVGSWTRVEPTAYTAAGAVAVRTLTCNPSLAVGGEIYVAWIDDNGPGTNLATNPEGIFTVDDISLSADGLEAITASPSMSGDFTVDTRDGSGAVLAQSVNFTVNTLVTSGGSATSSGFFTVETRGLDSSRMSATSGPGNFTVDTRRFPTAGLFTVRGYVRTTEGLPVMGATVEIFQIGKVPETAATDNHGFYQVSGLEPSAYRIKVSAAYYVPAQAQVDGSRGGTVDKNIQLKAALALVTPGDKGRGANAGEVLPATTAGASELKIYNRVTGVFETSGSLNANLPTMILTHGWLSDSEEWARGMFQNMVNARGMSGWNMVAWDWRGEAAAGIGQVVPSDKTTSQGTQLGQRLVALLGAGYQQNLHFIGHSLGTLVNRYACDYLHTEGLWNENQTRPHLTLLDEAEVSKFQGVNVLTAPDLAARQALTEIGEELSWKGFSDPAARVTLEAVGTRVNALIDDWKSPISSHAVYIDNYVSLVGWNRTASANVCLAPFNLLTAHSYAHQWYVLSTAAYSTAQMGFSRALAAGAAVPPMNADYAVGSLWLQSTLPFRNEMTLSHVSESFPGACSAYTLLNNVAVAPITTGIRAAKDLTDATGKAIVKTSVVVKTAIVDASQAIVRDVKAAGNWTAEQIVKTGNYIDAKVDQAVDFTRDVTADVVLESQQFWQTTKYKFKSSWGGNLRTARSSTSSTSSSTSTSSTSSSTSTSSSSSSQAATAGLSGSGVWITLVVPEDAAMLAFDFGIDAAPGQDCIVAAVNGTNIFHLEASYLTPGEIQTSGFLDVSSLAGQEAEFYFGFHGGTSQAEATIEGIRFLTVESPRLAITEDGPGGIELHWSSAAVGWDLQESATLGNDWATLGGIPGEVDAGVLTVKRPAVAGNRMFYRLKKH